MTCVRTIIALVVALVVTSQTDGSLVQLNRQNFAPIVVQSEQVWVVVFYSPRCSLCVEFVRDWKQMVENSYSGLEFGSVNIDEKEGYELAQEMGVFQEGMPNVKVFPYEFDGTGIAVWNGVEQPTIEDLQFKLQAILGDYLEGGHYRKLPHLVI